MGGSPAALRATGVLSRGDANRGLSHILPRPGLLSLFLPQDSYVPIPGQYLQCVTTYFKQLNFKQLVPFRIKAQK